MQAAELDEDLRQLMESDFDEDKPNIRPRDLDLRPAFTNNHALIESVSYPLLLNYVSFTKDSHLQA